MNFKPNDIVQIDPKINLRENPLMAGYQGCLVIVTEVHKDWLEGRIIIPQQEPFKINLSFKFIKVVGRLE